MSAVDAAGRPAGAAEWLSARAARKLLTTVCVAVPTAGVVLCFLYPLRMIARQGLPARGRSAGLR